MCFALIPERKQKGRAWLIQQITLFYGDSEIILLFSIRILSFQSSCHFGDLWMPHSKDML